MQTVTKKNNQQPMRVADQIEAIGNMRLEEEQYFGDHIQKLWVIYQTKSLPKEVRMAARKKYNEFVQERHKQLGRQVYVLIY